jgi:hypothetical protein
VYDETTAAWPHFNKSSGGEDQLNNIFDKVFFWRAEPNAIANNLKGQVIKHYDTGGYSSNQCMILRTAKFTTHSTFRDYKAVARWEDDNNLDINLEIKNSPLPQKQMHSGE